MKNNVFLVCMLLFSISVFGQELKIQGHLIDEEKQDLEEKENASSRLGKAMLDEVIGDVSKSEVDKVSGTLSYMMRNPLKELANEIEEEYEITPPPGVKP